MEITADTILGYGLMNKISTGHAWLDMALCLLVPVLLRSFIPFISDAWANFWNKPVASDKVFTRQIEHTRGSTWHWYESDADPQNCILQKAILNYINTHVELLSALPCADFQLKKKPREVSKEAKEKAATDGDGTDSEDECCDHDYSFNHVPPIDVWVDLKNGIEFKRNQEDVEDKHHKNTKIVYTLQSSDKNGNAKIDAFVDEALALYKAQQSTKIDHARYLYIPVLTGWAAARPSGDDGDNKAPTAIYKRYKLSEEKTFSSFFHPDKSSIIHLVNQFLNKKGKFGIPGYPQKLGFLLYGPPGTGKTSFIKALGQYTKRSVISIPLTKIHTNQELMDIMFDSKLKVEGSDDAVNLPYSKTIFVMEDVDAASSVVHRRTAAVSQVEMISAALAAQEEEKEQAKKEKIKKEKEDKSNGSDEIKTADDDDAKPKSKAKGFGPMPAFGKGLFNDDELNLAGLLNVLDGVVDTPNRIVIMTTNHPEKLDPALIRPGRINKKIYMGRICVEEALSMMQHYFGDISKPVETRLRQIFIDEALSPAELETMCADHDTAEEMVEQLDAKFGGRYILSGTPYVKTF